MITRPWYRRNRSTVRCREVGKVLQSYLDGDVEPDFAAKIAEHLDACRDCGLEAETYQRIIDSLAGKRPAVDEQTIARLREFGQSLTNE